MASKTHKAKRFSAAELFERVQRSLQKQDFKQAYKDAKVCYQQEPSQRHRHLLERAWFQRATALRRAGLEAESRESAKNLLDFGVTEPELIQKMPDLLAAVGLLDRALAGKGGLAVEVRPELLASAADQAVVSPATAPKSLPEIAPGAARVRAALESLHAGDEAAALDQLKDVPRSSPFADWRLFVRGLAAYYRGETAEVRANWDRLEEGRMAARIAASLRVLTEAGESTSDRASPGSTDALERAILGGSLTTYLQELQRCLAEDVARGAVKVLRRCRPGLQRVAPEILGRIERLLCATFVHKGDGKALEDLRAVATPPSMDPHWNRAFAMLWEHPHYDDVDGAERFWRRYLDDLAALPDLASAERAMAQAMVWERIGRMHAECSEDDDEWSDDEDDVLEEDRGAAVACFREAIRLAPGLLRAHQSLADAYSVWGKKEEAADAYRCLLDHFPDDLDALKFLFQYHTGRQEPIAARDYAVRAWRLKPANPEILDMAWSGHVAAARQFALEGKFDLGRAEFAAAERLGGDHGEPYHFLARKAIFEYKAGDTATGKRLADEAMAALEEPAPAVLVLLIEAIRYDLPYRLGGVVGDLEWQLRRSLTRKRHGKTAGRLCGTMTAFLASKAEYPGRSVHLEQVLGYIERCGKVRWEANDLRDVCLFLKALPEELQSSKRNDLFKKHVRQGLKKFPEVAEFPFMAGCMEIEKGPRRCKRTLARRYLELARDLGKKSGPGSAALVEMAEHQLTFLAEVGKFPSGMPGGYGGAGRFDDNEGEDYDPFEGIAPGKLFSEFAHACEALGLDPEEVLRDVAAGKPFRFSPPGGDGDSGAQTHRQGGRSAKR